MTAKYQGGAALATQDDYTATNAGCGRVKSDAKNPHNLNVNFTGPEYSQVVKEVIATQTVLGRIRSEPGDYGDVDIGSAMEVLRFLAVHAGNAGFVEHFLNRTGIAHWSPFLSNIGGGATAYTNAFNAVAIGVVDQTLVPGNTGWETTDDLFYQQATYMMFRWSVDTWAGAWANGDEIWCGFCDFAGSFVRFRSVMAGGAWPVWTVETDDGVGGTANDVLTVSPSADTNFHTYEIITTATSSTFWFDRGLVTQEKKTLAQAPLAANSEVALRASSAAGGDHLYTDIITARDTRALYFG